MSRIDRLGFHGMLDFILGGILLTNDWTVCGWIVVGLGAAHYAFAMALAFMGEKQ